MSFFTGNRHASPCHAAQESARGVKKFFEDYSPRPAPANRHRIVEGEDAASREAEPSSSRVVGLSMTRQMRAFGALMRLELEARWCVAQAEFASLSLASPTLEALSLTVTEPLGDRWLQHRQELDLHSGSAIRFPSLRSLTLTCVPVKSLDFSSRALPKLRHLRISCKGQLLTQQPYHHLSAALPCLEALEVAEVAVWAHVDLAEMTASPELRLLSIQELWVLNPVSNAKYVPRAPGQAGGFEAPQSSRGGGNRTAGSGAEGSQMDGSWTARSWADGGASGATPVGCFVHELVLPACRVCHVRNSINALGFELWAPQLTALHLLCSQLSKVRLLASAEADAPPGGFKPARVMLLRDLVDEETLSHLRRHPQLGELVWDDDAAIEMQQGLEVLKRCMSLGKARQGKARS